MHTHTPPSTHAHAQIFPHSSFEYSYYLQKKTCHQKRIIMVGCVAYGLKDVTAGAPQTIYLNDDATRTKLVNGTLWKQLVDWSLPFSLSLRVCTIVCLCSVIICSGGECIHVQHLQTPTILIQSTAEAHIGSVCVCVRMRACQSACVLAPRCCVCCAFMCVYLCLYACVCV